MAVHHPAARAARRPGPKPRLTREAVLEAATRVDPLSVAGVAAHLGVSVGGLYRHVEGLDDLAAGAVALLLGQAPFPDLRDGWRTFLEREAATHVRLRRDHAALFAVTSADLAVVAVQRSDRCVATLVEAGFDVDEALLVTDSVADLIRDGVRQALAIPPGADPPAGLTPPVDAAIRRVIVDPWAFLERKLALLLDGVEARRDRIGSR